ncbi:MAG: arginase [Planctomycetota bacterium]|nr:arginase [Planctomycetota bacterium]
MTSRSIGIVGVPLDLGAGRRGTDMGPSAVRLAGLSQELKRLGFAVAEHGGVPVAIPERRQPGDPSFRFGKEIARTCGRLRDRVKAILLADAMPLVLGGDHSIAMGTVAGVAAHAGEIGLLWIDAHADLNTAETSPSGNVHGMPLAALLGRGHQRLLDIGETSPVVSVEHTAIVGLRSVDAGERERIRRLGVSVHTMSDIDERGMSVCMAEAIDRVTAAAAGFHLSLDMDALDPDVAPGVGTPVTGGLTYREAHYACERVARSKKLLSMEVVEVNPMLDVRNRTGQLAVELILSALGKTIT